MIQVDKYFPVNHIEHLWFVFIWALLYVDLLSCGIIVCIIIMGLPTFPTCSQMAELRRNQRGEIGPQLLKAHYAAASLHVWSHLTHPDQWRRTSDRPWHRGLRLLLVSINVTGSFATDVKDGGVKANSLTSPPNDAIICTKKGVFSHS